MSGDLNEMYNGMRVVAVLQNKGGVGKTFLASNLAVRADMGQIPEQKKRVLLLDVDPQQNLSTTFLKMETLPGRESQLPPLHPDYDPDFPEHVEWGGRSSSIGVYYGHPVLPYECEGLNRVDILPADGNTLGNFHAAMQAATDEELVEALKTRLREFFEQEDVQDLYDLIIIDCPPGKGLIHIPILRAATDVIIPCVPQAHSIDGTNQTINSINNQNIERHAPPINIVGVIPNQFDVRSNDYKDFLDVMRTNRLWGELVPDFELRNLKDYRITHLPQDFDKLKSFKNAQAEKGMQDFISLFRRSVYGSNQRG